MRKNKRLIVIDLDGTLFDNFFEVDRKIIEEIFDKNTVVLFIDNIARLINSSGLVKNNTKILKIRLFIYCLLSGKKYNKVICKYRNKYIFYADKAIKANLCEISLLESINECKVLILSNNRYSVPLSVKYNVLTVKNKGRKLKQLYREYGKYLLYVIGDNYFDDILPARVLGIPNIYIRNKRGCYYEKNIKSAFSHLSNHIDF